MIPPHDHTATIGFLGSATALGSGLVSTLEHLDLWFRVGTSFFGLCVGIVTLIYMVRKLKRQ